MTVGRVHAHSQFGFDQVGRAGADRMVAPAMRRPNALVAWLALAGIFVPLRAIDIGGFNFTPALLVIVLLFLPAVVSLYKSNRKWIQSDYFAIITATWMVIASLLNGGFRPYVGAEALEFVGAYLVGRAYFSNRRSLELFIGVLKPVTIVIILLGLLDTLTGRPVVQQLVGIGGYQVDYRAGLLRADSVFPVGELFGTFCVAATALFLYSERTLTSRIFYVGLSVLGAVLSLSSGPLLGLAIVLSVFVYDLILRKRAWRWKLFGLAVFALTLSAFIVSNAPVAFLVRNLTLNPETGYFRLATWNFGLEEVARSPILGEGITSYAGASDLVQIFVGKSVDALWLVLMLRYGVTVVVFLLATIFLPFLYKDRGSARDLYMNNIRMGLSLAVLCMSYIALTVHFWDSIWVFFALCIGIRASFVEITVKQSPIVAPRKADLSRFVVGGNRIQFGQSEDQAVT